ncbi:MAG: YhcN/YlaJ family sporulation lipoprotein [Clostridia bacterium]|nr:YhcN/YlaJ family sporulation lipoprotein [Clostridia bacterium]
MKKTLMTLGMLACAATMTACTATTDMTTATNEPTSTTYVSPSPEVTNVAPEGIIDGVMDDAGNALEDAGDAMDNMMDGNGLATQTPDATGVTSMDKARRVVEQIEDELERLSEVDDAQVILSGNKAAVALEFDDQYRGGIDDRLRGIVSDRIGSVISGISTIAITSDEGIMDAIERLGESLNTMSDMTALQADVDRIIQQINGSNA